MAEPTQANLRSRVRDATHTIFVRYFDQITDPTWTTTRIVDHILEQVPYDRAGLVNRVAACRRLVTAGDARAALKLISKIGRDKAIKQRAADLYESQDGHWDPGEFTVCESPSPAAPKSFTRPVAGLRWYWAADGVLCADVHGEIAGAITLEVEVTGPDNWIARARGFLAIVIHEIRNLPDEETAIREIATWWAQVKA